MVSIHLYKNSWMKLTEMLNLHHSFLLVFHCLRFGWSSFDIIMLHHLFLLRFNDRAEPQSLSGATSFINIQQPHFNEHLLTLAAWIQCQSLKTNRTVVFINVLQCLMPVNHSSSSFLPKLYVYYQTMFRLIL